MPRAACAVSTAVLLLCFWRPSVALDVCEAPSMLRPRFVLFGDSLTQRSFENGGFGAGLTNAYQRQVRPQALSIRLSVSCSPCVASGDHSVHFSSLYFKCNDSMKYCITGHHA